MSKFALVVLLAVVLLAPAGAGQRCQFWPVRGRPVCWCYGAYGWQAAPALFCRLGGAS